MTEQNAGNPETGPAPNEAGTPGEGAANEQREPEKFAGKSREDVLKSYVELEKMHGTQAETLKQAETFIQQVSPFFNADPDSGRVDWNDEMGKRLAETRGWIQPQEPPEEKPDEKKEKAVNNQFMQQFEENPEQAILEAAKTAAAEAARDAVMQGITPLQQQVNSQMHNNWMQNVKARHPDFDEYRPKIGQLLNNHNFAVNNEADLENAYIAAKALDGGMIDKKDAESQQMELQKALQVYNPGVSIRKDINPETATTEELIGLKHAGQKTHHSDKIQELFGKGYLRQN